jgi:hypothetical protein
MFSRASWLRDFRELWIGEVRRILLPRTWVNKAKKGRVMEAPALVASLARETLSYLA